MLISSGKDGKPNSPFKPLNLIAGLLILAGILLLFMQNREKQEDPQAAEMVFKLEGKDYSIDDLPHRYRQQFYEIANNAYQRQRNIVATAASEMYVEQQMEQTGQSKQEVVKRLFDPKPPTRQQIEQFYQQNRQRINAPLDKAANQIALLMMAQAQQQKQAELLKKLNELDEFALYLQPPSAPIIDVDTLGYPAKGPADAKVTLVEFGDYQCGHCLISFRQLAQTLPDYQDRVRFIFMDFPINSSGISRKVAEGAQCALQQDKFWEFHDMAYDRQSQLTADSPVKFAQELGLNMGQFEQCLDDPATAAKVKASADQAIQSGATGTPTFFLNGIKLSDQDRKRTFKQLLDEALEASNGAG